MLQLRLEIDGDLTRFQPPQVSVVNIEDGAVGCLLLTTTELFYRHQAILESAGCFYNDLSMPVSCDVLRGSDFRISERYRCVADSKGQAQGGVGFVFEGLDMLDGSKVCKRQNVPPSPRSSHVSRARRWSNICTQMARKINTSLNRTGSARGTSATGNCVCRAAYASASSKRFSAPPALYYTTLARLA